MNFLIADTFTDSLSRLTGDEQKAVKTTAFDLQLDPASPGMKFHRLDRAKDKNFWSVRVNSDVRIIVHKTQSSLLLCYVDHHDPAYQWAERRRLETHPQTGAAQLVEIRQTVQEIVVPTYVERRPRPARTRPLLFGDLADETLLGYGVPPDWLNDVRTATEDNLLSLADHLPAEAAEALLELATGGKPRTLPAFPATADPFAHPDAQRRFRVMANVEELQRALDYPWEKWLVFLHPEQRQWVERDYAGPARVSGSAGTGKTIVALHRAAYLARSDTDARVLLTTFSDPLANALREKLRRLLSSEPRLAERIEVCSLDALAVRMAQAQRHPTALADRAVVAGLIREAAAVTAGHKFTPQFLLTEWEQIVDAWQLKTWEAFRDVARLGRKTRLTEPQRRVMWTLFERVLAGLTARGLTTHAALYASLSSTLPKGGPPLFDYCVIDECQDLSISQMRFLATLGNARPNALFFAGDVGQRIFQQPFSWKALGVDIRGRSRTLKVNYRMSHQIRTQSDRLLDGEVADLDGNSEKRTDTVSVFNGPLPLIQRVKSEAEEIRAVSSWLKERAAGGILPHEFGLFVRSDQQLDRARTAAAESGIPCKVLDEHVQTARGHLAISTMHLAKGLEFRAVAVMACDDEVIPLQSRIDTVGDDSDLQEVYNTERQLLYVACTRARDHLLVTGVQPASEFLDDLDR